MKLSKALDGFFLARTVDGYSPSTLTMYRWALNLMTRFLNDPDVSEVDPKNMLEFWVYLRQDYQPNRHTDDHSPLQGRSLENIWTAMRSFWGWAEREQYTKARPDMRIQRPRYTPREVQPFSMEEVKALLAACDCTTPAKTEKRSQFTMPRQTTLRDKTIILTLLDTGLRASELARLRIDDINLESGEIVIKGFGTGYKSRPRIVYISKPTIRLLWKYLATRSTTQDDFLFLSTNNAPLNRGQLLKLIHRMGERAKVHDAHPHRFRHTFAIQFLRNGGDIFSLQRLLGHRDLEMVKRYLQLAETDVKNAHKSASPVDRWKL